MTQTPSREPVERRDKFLALDNSRTQPFDVLIIGGGATGLGIAVDAATRGFRTALVDAGDFAQATSSRATKLVHGGVRYLASGQIHLVYEALHERAVMLRNAPHLVHPQRFLLPTYTRWQLPYYGAGLLAYDLLSGRSSMGPTRILGSQATLREIPNMQPQGLSGSVLYHDGQFNDARFALALARTAEDHGATVLNYARCTRFLHTDGKVCGAIVADVETGEEVSVQAHAIVNATGIFTDELRHLDDARTPPLLTVSRGTHLVVAASVLGGQAGIMVPKTRDGRVIFAIPWQGKVVIGTTDDQSVSGADDRPRRCPVGLLRPPSPGHRARSDHVEDLARTPYRCLRDRTGDSSRREMDHLPADGAGYSRLRRGERPAGASTLRDRPDSAARCARTRYRHIAVHGRPATGRVWNRYHAARPAYSRQTDTRRPDRP
jgi:glycine/D-amino acid oxidase-like deaminating enzyme